MPGPCNLSIGDRPYILSVARYTDIPEVGSEFRHWFSGRSPMLLSYLILSYLLWSCSYISDASGRCSVLTYLGLVQTLTWPLLLPMPFLSGVLGSVAGRLTLCSCRSAENDGRAGTIGDRLHVLGERHNWCHTTLTAMARHITRYWYRVTSHPEIPQLVSWIQTKITFTVFNTGFSPDARDIMTIFPIRCAINHNLKVILIWGRGS